MDIHCTQHPKRTAKARCVECGTTLCGDCRLKLEARNYCRPCVPDHLRKKIKGQRSPTAAAVLSALPGLGQMYAGSFFRGLVFGGSGLLLASQTLQLPDPMPLFLWIYNLVDAFLLAQDRNAKVTGVELSATDKRQKRFWGLLAGAVAAFMLVRNTVQPELNPDLMWPVALGLYGLFLLFDRKEPDVRHA